MADPDTDDAPGRNPDLTSINVRRALGGDLHSLEWIVSRLSPCLVAQASYRMGPMLRRHCEPEELVHEVWLAALPHLAGLTARESRMTPVLLRYLTTAVLNRVQNLGRLVARRAPPALPLGAPDETGVPAATSGVVTRAVRNERRSAVHDALAELDRQDREVVLLRGIEQLPNRVVATILGIGEAAVAKRYQRAMRRLRDRLPGSLFDELESGDGDEG